MRRNLAAAGFLLDGEDPPYLVASKEASIPPSAHVQAGSARADTTPLPPQAGSYRGLSRRLAIAFVVLVGSLANPLFVTLRHATGGILEVPSSLELSLPSYSSQPAPTDTGAARLLKSATGFAHSIGALDPVATLAGHFGNS